MLRPDVVKEVFFVHSRGSPSAAAAVERAKTLLEGIGFEAWDYEDWKWQLRDRRRYGSSGSRFDVGRIAGRHPEPFFDEIEGSVDTDTLNQIFELTRVVVCVAPLPDETPGVVEELELLQLQASDVHAPPPAPTVLFQIGDRAEYLYERLDLDESVAVKVGKKPTDSQINAISMALGLLVLRYLLSSEPHPHSGSPSRWEEKITIARVKIPELLARGRALATAVDSPSALPDGAATVLRDQAIKLEELLM